MRSTNFVLLAMAGAVIAACSSNSAAPDGGSPGDDGGTTLVADTGVSEAAAPLPDGGSGDAAGGPIVTGQVVDASVTSAAKNFDATQYPGLAGVDVCVYGQSSAPCTTTDANGSYTLAVPAGAAVTMSYAKTGYASALYVLSAMAAGTTNATAAIFMSSTSTFDSFQTTAGATPDATKGVILFGGGTLGAAPGSVYHETFGPYDYYYASGYSLTISPAATVGPVYVNTDWSPDPSLMAATTAGWGYIQAPPGMYTLTYSSPTLNCGMTTATVVAGYVTTYVGVTCTVEDAGAPVVDASTDGG